MSLVANAHEAVALCGRGLGLLAQLDLDGFHAQRLAGGAGHLAVLHPVLPADVLHVRAVEDVVVLRDLASQCEPDGLHA